MIKQKAFFPFASHAARPYRRASPQSVTSLKKRVAMHSLLRVRLIILFISFFVPFSLQRGETSSSRQVNIMHIPKTAGRSLLYDFMNLTGRNVQLIDFPQSSDEIAKGKDIHYKYNSREDCLYKMNRNKKNWMVSMFRSPREQVYSLFLECKYDGWGKRTTFGTGFPRHTNDLVGFSKW